MNRPNMVSKEYYSWIRGSCAFFLLPNFELIILQKHCLTWRTPHTSSFPYRWRRQALRCRLLRLNRNENGTFLIYVFAPGMPQRNTCRQPSKAVYGVSIKRKYDFLEQKHSQRQEMKLKWFIIAECTCQVWLSCHLSYCPLLFFFHWYFFAFDFDGWCKKLFVLRLWQCGHAVR